MVTLFGEEPPSEEKNEKKVDRKFWIENVTDNISFEIHSNMEIDPDFSVFVTSGVASFESKTEAEIIDNVLMVKLFINIESLSQVDNFQVFLKNDNCVIFVGEMSIPMDVLIESKEIPRLDKNYKVSFPKKNHFASFNKQKKNYNSMIKMSDIDGGVTVRITADTCDRFSQRLISTSSMLPEGSVFTPIEDQKSQINASHEIARNLSHFAQLEENDCIDKSVLLSLKSLLDESLSVLFE